MELLLPLLLTLPAAAWAMIFASLTIAMLMAGGFLLFAYGFQNPQMIALGKDELAALLLTVFIIFFWVSFDGVMNTLMFGLLQTSMPEDLRDDIDPNACISGSGSSCIQGMANSHITLAIASLDVIELKLRSQYVDLFLFEALIGFLSTVSFPIGSPVGPVAIVSFSFAPFTGLVLLSNAHTMVVETIGLMLTLVWSKRFILIFARDIVPILLLPLGLVARAFPFYRKTGSSIIALAFAAYYILPFSVLLTNYLIFDIFQPADFAYTPSSASYFDTDRSQADWEGDIEEAREGSATSHLNEQFRGRDVVEETYDDPIESCAGNWVVRLFCSVSNIINTAVGAVTGFIATIWNIWRFMMGMTGDFFFSLINNPALPSSASAGLYYFIIKEVATISPFIILIILTTVIEIILTTTMYRNISMLIGGEAEIIGLTKIV